uniref:Uncharacterized protein n=1 Tax=Anopheles atroparvus TaxID=41427 RepID=A0AAG5DJ13_ANOAO
MLFYHFPNDGNRRHRVNGRPAVLPLHYRWICFIRLLAFINPDDFANAAAVTYSGQFVWEVFYALAWTLAILAVLTVLYWYIDKWSNHPIAKHLQLFTKPTMPDWRSVATNINDEYRRNTKMEIRSNAISTLVVTENWIIKTNLYRINVAHQNETSLVGYKIDIQDVTTDISDASQYVNIAVKPLQDSKHFIIRVSGEHFSDFQDHVNRPIVLLPSVKFRTLIDLFVEVFKEQATLNPVVRFTPLPDMDHCLGCLQVQPDVKIEKHCLDVDASGAMLPEDQRCEPCLCRPQWCITCMALWFASRQQRAERDTWLSKKATCPMCRARFCVLDVCRVESVVQNQ